MLSFILIILLSGFGEKQLYIHFYARFPYVVIIWRSAKDALHKQADLYNKNYLSKISFGFFVLTSTDEEQFNVQFYVWVAMIVLPAAKDVHAFVIDVIFTKEKKIAHLAWGW